VLFRINATSGVPIYLQLIEQLRYAIETGALRAGDQLPGLRKVAEELVINPNTVAKAYREMEHDGLITLRHGAGAFVAETPSKPSNAIQRARAVLHKALATIRDMGLDDGEIRRMVEAELTQPQDPIQASAIKETAQ
jgi:GntR family transcriptional regulator